MRTLCGAACNKRTRADANQPVKLLLYHSWAQAGDPCASTPTCTIAARFACHCWARGAAAAVRAGMPTRPLRCRCALSWCSPARGVVLPCHVLLLFAPGHQLSTMLHVFRAALASMSDLSVSTEATSACDAPCSPCVLAPLPPSCSLIGTVCDWNWTSFFSFGQSSH